ncbi:acyl-CoA thioesterase [Stakelama sp. CBK3Z-3]|uniref:Acyl-CoA thioesterase n=1 Tax=Stakelama flava TaxID=2860338 RepID=A0ABS6XLE9_9SPHN|nr:thioesterase family protein [Stakelama flava]MBW4331032.1 acyl-CoA thioesterase [Stakelama flava]
MPLMHPHRHEIAIEPDDIDFMGHVNNAVYLNWVQEAVVAYWQKVAPAEEVARHLWVALKHEITYRRPAFLDDDIVATVAAERVEGARALFKTAIKRGEEVVAEVKSTWCSLDASTMRPMRIARHVSRRFIPE